MTNNDLIPFYALVCGKHLHKTVLIDNQDGYEGDTICPDCRKVWIGNVEVEQFNPYVTFEDTTELTLEVRKIIEKQWPKMWEEYLENTALSTLAEYDGDSQANEVLRMQLSPQEVYDWMELHPEDWAWAECPDSKNCGPGTRCWENEDSCATGKIPHPAWVWIKGRRENDTKYPI